MIFTWISHDSSPAHSGGYISQMLLLRQIRGNFWTLWKQIHKFYFGFQKNTQKWIFVFVQKWRFPFIPCYCLKNSCRNFSPLIVLVPNKKRFLKKKKKTRSNWFRKWWFNQIFKVFLLSQKMSSFIFWLVKSICAHYFFARALVLGENRVVKCVFLSKYSPPCVFVGFCGKCSFSQRQWLGLPEPSHCVKIGKFSIWTPCNWF